MLVLFGHKDFATHEIKWEREFNAISSYIKVNLIYSIIWTRFSLLHFDSTSFFYLSINNPLTIFLAISIFLWKIYSARKIKNFQDALKEYYS